MMFKNLSILSLVLGLGQFGFCQSPPPNPANVGKTPLYVLEHSVFDNQKHTVITVLKPVALSAMSTPPPNPANQPRGRSLADTSSASVRMPNVRPLNPATSRAHTAQPINTPAKKKRRAKKQKLKQEKIYATAARVKAAPVTVAATPARENNIRRDGYWPKDPAIVLPASYVGDISGLKGGPE